MTERHFTALQTPFEVEFSGMRLIEAGAGTGKTWTLAALVLRLLLERRLKIGQILVVTYTRAASGELKSRIRARLVEALAAFETGQAEDEYLQALIERCEPTEAKTRIRLAIESFDTAAIFTIHGFCQRALDETAFWAGQPFERELIADQNELLADVARDAWRREMAKATPLWAQYLMDKLKGPDGLVAKVKDHLGRAAVTVGVPLPVDRLAAESRLLESWRLARGFWLAEGEALQRWLRIAQLKRNIYPEQKIDAVVLAADAWFAEELPLLPLSGDLHLLSRQKIERARTKASPAPEHPFFAAMEALLQTVDAFQAACDAALRGLCAAFLVMAREQLTQRKRESGLQSYDDLLFALDQALDGPAGKRLIDALRARYPVALVDEFQDTDTLQLRIFTRIFGSAAHPLIFVGDPKQAIYAFRGADVFAYLAARKQADAGHALLENRRSDKPLLDAINALFARPRPFLLDDLPYEPALPADQERAPCTIDDECAPLTLWWMTKPAQAKSFTKEDGRTMAAQAVAADIARLLALAAAGRATIGERPLSGGDIAVLVRKHQEGELVRQALSKLGIPAVSGGGGSVWESEEAEDLERLLLAIAQPSREALVRGALSTVLLGADAAQLAAWRDDDQAWSARLETFHDDLVLLHERGFMAMWRRLLRRERVVARMLARPDGERRLTNYRHLAELLQSAEQKAALDAEGLARFIADQRTAAENEDSLLRLESDAHLVRIVTQHAAKGLQYPIVYCPFLWIGTEEAKAWPVFAHRDGGACLDFGSPEMEALLAAKEIEAAAEELRLAYVALTRAEHRCIVIWGKANNCARSPLAWLLFGPRSEVAEDPRVWLAQWLETHDETETLRALEGQLGGALKVLPLPSDGEAALPPATVPQEWRPRIFTGRIPSPWQVRSFSSLAAQLAEEAERADHDAIASWGAALPAPSFQEISVPDGASSMPAAPADIQAFPRGTRAGSCLHALFERIDFQQRQSVGPVAAQLLAEYGYALAWQPVLERLVADVLSSPLNAEGLRLIDVPSEARIAEMAFTFPQDSSAGRAGYMKGFIDLVFRANGRWYIVDWKSNWLEDYGPQALAAAMQAHRYDLQLRIYAAALKRALAWREPACDWEASFGGVFYLFLRGMKPGSGAGVFFSRPTVVELEAFLDEVVR
ncbi:exodeoxyribonuclease V subunit beta [Sulfuricystis multivorans]|uniref:exodeoxyribonuclease V subunit beta n=1 Tax=Sulfuricystis multivorans TaxID=2211108 RepID=UPI000F82559E|nr:exodeoxyribonuclease V subunit beta [Sulfuricystis multivorans]